MQNGLEDFVNGKRMDTKEASAYLRELGTPFSPGTLEVWRSQGRGPRYIKLQRKVFYDPADLDAFSIGQTVETTESFTARH